MNRRKFFAFLPALFCLPALCKTLAESKRYWAGTMIPRSNPWRELDESQKRAVMASQGYQYTYFYKNKDGKLSAPPMPKEITIYRSSI